MMKFVTNHPSEFNMPKVAFCVGLMQFLGGFACEVACITFLSTIDKTIDVIIKFIALGSIAKIDDFYAAALPPENKVKKNAALAAGAMKITKYQRNINRHTDKGQTCGMRALRVVYKVIRIIYSSFIFYFLPFMVLFMPYMVPTTAAE